jgi:PEP-CTERM motif
VLGFGTADSWNDKVSGGNFTGVNAVAAFGGKVVPLAPDLAHWKDGTQSTVMGVSQEAMMDPTLRTGTRKLPTQLDLAALKDVGWQVTAVPLPSAVWLFGSALIAFAGLRRRQSITA